MTTRLPPYETAILVKSPCSHRAWNASLSRCAWPLLIRSLATAASLNEGFPEIRHRCLRVASPVAIACQLFYRFLRETSKTNEGVWKETTESAPTFQLSRVAIGKRHKKWHITADSDAMPTFQTVNYANSEGGLPPPSPPVTDASHT